MREDWTVDMNILPGEERKKKEVILLKCNMNEERREPFERESWSFSVTSTGRRTMRSDGTIKVTFLVTVAESCPVTILLLLFSD